MVAVDDVAAPEERVGVAPFQDAPQRLRLVSVGAGADVDARSRRRRRHGLFEQVRACSAFCAASANAAALRCYQRGKHKHGSFHATCECFVCITDVCGAVFWMESSSISTNSTIKRRFASTRFALPNLRSHTCCRCADRPRTRRRPPPGAFDEQDCRHTPAKRNTHSNYSSGALSASDGTSSSYDIASLSWNESR